MTYKDAFILDAGRLSRLIDSKDAPDAILRNIHTKCASSVLHNDSDDYTLVYYGRPGA